MSSPTIIKADRICDNGVNYASDAAAHDLEIQPEQDAAIQLARRLGLHPEVRRDRSAALMHAAAPHIWRLRNKSETSRRRNGADDPETVIRIPSGTGRIVRGVFQRREHRS